MIGNPIALRIRREIERAPAALVARFAEAQTSFIADAQQGWNCMHHSVKPLKRSYRFAGTAVTARGGPRDNLAAMAMLDVVQEGDVLVIATECDESGAVIGDHWAAVARQLGAVAVVTDGLVRDAEGIEKLGPPTFSRGTSPNAGYRNGPGEVNMPISVAGVSVRPGDIIVGDRDGVVVIHREMAAQIAERLERVVEVERQTEEKVRKGERRRFWDPAAFRERGVEYVD